MIFICETWINIPTKGTSHLYAYVENGMWNSYTNELLSNSHNKDYIYQKLMSETSCPTLAETFVTKEPHIYMLIPRMECGILT